MAGADRRESELFERYSEQHDLDARRALVERYLPLARSLVRQFRHPTEPLEDLTQTAYVGLLKAIDRFDPSRGSAFSSFAVPTIRGELQHHLRDRAAAVRVPRDTQDRLVALRHERERLMMQLGRVPAPPELAAHLSCGLDELLETQCAERARLTHSLDDPLLLGDRTVAVSECVGAEDSAYARVEARMTIKPMLSELPDHDRLVLRLRFHDELSQTEIAERIGCSQVHVSRTLRRILDGLAARHESAVARATSDPSPVALRAA